MCLLLLFTTTVHVDTLADVNKVLNNWHLAAAKADEKTYFGYLADDSVFLGTDATERWNKTEFQRFAHPFFAKGKAWSFVATRRGVMFSKDGKVAWFDEELKTENMGPCRGSGVLILDKGNWKIAHYNLTLTIPNDQLASVKKLLEEAAKGK
ncbi:MAG TPA: nuclear transport factor 2 family protein [Gemmatales bacterium]|nr:nuclear transport factor 2 family protein [Gemmatales bacterium]